MTIVNEPPTVTATAYPMPEEEGGISMTNIPTATNVPTANSPYGVAAPPPPPMGTTSSPDVVVLSINAPTMTTTIHGDQPKVGAKCCGCCCDFRKAVMIVDVIIIAFSIYSTVEILTNPDAADAVNAYSEENQSITAVDDDQVRKELDQITNDALLADAIIGGILVLLMIVPLYGAYKYQIRLLMFGIFVLVASFVARFTVGFFFIQDADNVSDKYAYDQPYFFYAISAVVVSLFIYPHLGLMMEIQQGIMSPETYPREEYCCCGGTRPRPPTGTATSATATTQA